MISYPLSTPCVPRSAVFSLAAKNAVALSQSDFTYSSQVHVYPGQMWTIQVSLPRMREAQAEEWLAWGVALKGFTGTFLFGHPFKKNRGTATTATVTGAANSGSVTVTMTGTLAIGDMIQIGSASDATLHKVLVAQSGSGTLEIWPALRKARSGALCVLSDPKGVFRLNDSVFEWDVDNVRNSGLSFSAMEAI